MSSLDLSYMGFVIDFAGNRIFTNLVVRIGAPDARETQILVCSLTSGFIFRILSKSLKLVL